MKNRTSDRHSAIKLNTSVQLSQPGSILTQRNSRGNNCKKHRRIWWKWNTEHWKLYEKITQDKEFNWFIVMAWLCGFYTYCNHFVADNLIGYCRIITRPHSNDAYIYSKWVCDYGDYWNKIFQVNWANIVSDMFRYKILLSRKYEINFLDLSKWLWYKMFFLIFPKCIAE